MTVSTTSNKITYNGDASTTTFSFTFPGVSASDIKVYLTDSAGTVTGPLASSLYTVVLTPAVSPNPTGIGGSVTYPLTGSPIALGVMLTIIRTLPLTQPTSLSNQGTLYPTAIEEAFDDVVMQVQQLNELLGRQITVAVSDSTPTALPAAAARAGLYMAFDSSGNPTAVAGSTSTNPVSSAMTPVVGAATLALARTAMGLGNMATEAIGTGLQDDGSGNVRVNGLVTADSTNKAVVASFHLTERHATAAITYTNPASSTLFSGFGYFVYALGGDLTIAIDAGDTFYGAASGASYIISQGSWAFISTNAAGTWYVRGNNVTSLNAPLNLQLNATVAASALTIAIKDRNGNNPSAASPVMLAFRDPTVTNGNPSFLAITSALSLVVPSTATLGTTSAYASRLWVVAFNNGGTPVLGVVLCSNLVQIFPLDESVLRSGVAISTGSTSAGTIYSASTITTKAFRILGYIESTQATAGTWATTPSKIQLFGVGIKKPGDVVQSITVSSATQTTFSASTTLITTALTVSITPTSAANKIRLMASALGAAAGAGVLCSQLSRGAAPTLIGSLAGCGASNAASTMTNYAFDAPNTASATTYAVYAAQTSATSSATYNAAGAGFTTQGVIEAMEIMG